MQTAPDSPFTSPDFEDELNAVDKKIESLIRHCTIIASGDNAISRSTMAFNCLSDGYSKLLLTRAKQLANKGKLEEAISDALKAIEYKPTSSEVYFAVGELYATRGNQQDAILIYEQGLRAVLPSECPLLYERREAAKKQMNRRIDFVASLPFEVSIRIFLVLLRMHASLNSCTIVSKLWRDYLLNRCPELWRDIYIDGYSCSTDSSAIRLLPLISKHVRSLVLYRVPDYILEKLCRIAQNDRMSSVTGLELDLELDTIEQHTRFIALFADSLTRLRIDISSGNDPETAATVDLHAIISLCPNLEYLTWYSDYNISYHPVQSPPPLLGLAIEASNSHEQLGNLISQFPHLQQLLTGTVLPETFSVIFHSCPRLNRLEIGSEFDADSLSITSNLNKQSDLGLHTFAYCLVDDNVVQNVIPFFIKSASTLRTLTFYIVNGSAAEVSQLAQVKFSHLTEMELYIAEEHLQSVASMISQCPMLENVLLNFGSEKVPDRFFMCLTNKPLLHTLELQQLKSPATGICRLLTHYVECRQECKLRDIAFILGGSITYDILATLADITTLQKIKLSVSLQDVSDDELTRFISKLHTLPYLKAVKLEDIPQISDSMIAELVQIDGLEELSLSRQNGTTPAGVQHALENRVCTLKDVSVLNY